MPPKKKPRTSDEPQAVLGEQVALDTVTIELASGETDAQNVGYTTAVMEAWEIVRDDPRFARIATAEPATIRQGGVPSPFNSEDFCSVLGKDGGSYVCGINLAWLDFTWTATPGIPIRMAAVRQIRDVVFQTPKPIEQIHVAVPSPNFDVTHHKGALNRVSPEEITSAFILAVARDIVNKEPDDVIKKWKQHMRSTTCRFVVLPNQWKRYWYALARREEVDHTYRAVVRSCYQRVHEVVRMMDRMRQKMPESQVTAPRVEAEYKENLQNMNKNSSAAITANFVDVAMTVAKRMVAVPEIAQILQKMDESAAANPDFFNPFNSHTRLQAMIDKCKKTDMLLWCLQATAYRCEQGSLTTLSASDIKGTAASGNRGLFDLFLFKRQMRDVLIAKGRSMFGDDAVAWIHTTVSKHTESFVTWAQQEAAGNLTWRVGRRPSEVMWLNLLIEAVFGTSYDAPLKLAIKMGQSAEEALQAGLAQAWLPIVEKREQEGGSKAQDEKRDEKDDENEVEAKEEQDVEFVVPDKSGKEAGATKVVKLSELDDENQIAINTIIRDTRLQLRAQVQFISLERGPPYGANGFLTEVLKAPAAAMKDLPSSQFVAIFFDPKLSGEPLHRPGLRTASVRAETYNDIVKVLLGRHGMAKSAIGEQDLYFVMDGGKQGAQNELLKPFAGKEKSVKTYMIHKDEESMMQRYGKVMGVATIRLEETLMIISAKKLALPRQKFQQFNGSTAGSMLGPVFMKSLEASWELSWAAKKELYGPKNLIGVGGETARGA